VKQFNNAKYASIDPPAHIADLWSRWLQSQGFTGSLQDLEFAYFQSKGYENWSEYLASLGYTGHLNDQKRRFWQDFQSVRRGTLPPTILQRTVHIIAATSLGVWLIEKYVGMHNRMAA
jgi:hypothetical protein